MIKPIFTSLSPNTEKDDIFLAFKLLFQPWKYKTGSVEIKLQQDFEKYLGVKYAFSFNSGRASLTAILEAIGIKKGDEVLLQAFTCNAAVNPILKLKAEPVFIDVDSTINMDVADLKRKITSRARAVMIQHTFGWPAKIDEILKLARKNNLFLIEDCAHSLGAKYGSRAKRENHPPPVSTETGGGSSTFQPRYASGKVGTFGTASFFSFGRDKMISSIFGGMAVTNDERIAKRIKKIQEELDYPSNFWIFQQLLHPILVNYLISPCYGLNQYLGRIVLGFLHKISILSKAVYKKEKRGESVKYFPKKLPNALAMLALSQFQKLERFNHHRKELAEFYKRNLKNRFLLPLSKKDKARIPVFMRYPILVDYDTDNVLERARKRKIFLDDGWRKSPIVPLNTNLKKMNYNLGSCPRAEKIAEQIINLPTYINISKKESQKIVNFLNNYSQDEN